MASRGSVLKSTPVRVLMAVIPPLLAVAARAPLAPALEDRLPFITFFPAVMLSGWLGFWPGMVGTLLGALLVNYTLLPPARTIFVHDTGHLLGLTVLVGTGLTVSWQSGRIEKARRSLNAALASAERSAQEARHAAELERAAREAQGELLGILAHDLRNPLGIVLMHSAMIERQATDTSGSVVRHAAAITRAAGRMDELIRDLLDASTVEAGGLQVDVRREDVVAVVRETLAMLEPLAVQKRIDLSAELPGSAPVRCERSRLIQVLQNIVGNALKFAPEGGRVRVAVEAGPRVQITVSDNGPGIPEALLPHLFKRYHRGPREGGGGTGLGLYIAHGIVKAHGGAIEVESGQGQGATFRLVLPAAAGD